MKQCVIFQLKGGNNMLNQVVLVGRIVKTPELRVTETGKKTATVTLAVPRNYKNMMSLSVVSIRFAFLKAWG